MTQERYNLTQARDRTIIEDRVTRGDIDRRDSGRSYRLRRSRSPVHRRRSRSPSRRSSRAPIVEPNSYEDLTMRRSRVEGRGDVRTPRNFRKSTTRGRERVQMVRLAVDDEVSGSSYRSPSPRTPAARFEERRDLKSSPETEDVSHLLSGLNLGPDRDLDRIANALPRLPSKCYSSRISPERTVEFAIGNEIRLQRDPDFTLRDERRRQGFKKINPYENYLVVGNLAEGMLLVQDRHDELYWIHDSHCRYA